MGWAHGREIEPVIFQTSTCFILALFLFVYLRQEATVPIQGWAPGRLSPWVQVCFAGWCLVPGGSISLPFPVSRGWWGLGAQAWRLAGPSAASCLSVLCCFVLLWCWRLQGLKSPDLSLERAVISVSVTWRGWLGLPFGPGSFSQGKHMLVWIHSFSDMNGTLPLAISLAGSCVLVALKPLEGAPGLFPSSTTPAQGKDSLMD